MHRVDVRLAVSADAGSIRAVVSAAFGTHSEVVLPLIDELRRTGAVASEHVAEVDGRIVGHVLLSRGWIDAAAGVVPVHVLSPLAVEPARQRQGIGRALIEHATGASEDAGVPAVFLEGDPAYCRRSGFDPAVPKSFRAPSVRIPESAFQVRLLAAHEPWMTGTLVYADAFWTMNAIRPA